MNLEFASFWKLYPRKREKKDAEKAWNSLMKRGVKSDAILSTLQDRVRTDWKRWQPEFIPYPASFLRAEDFDDEFEAREDDKEAMPLFTKLETDTHLQDRAELIHRSLTREQEVWRRNAAEHTHTVQCQWGAVCAYRKEPRVPTMDELLEHLKAGR